MEKGLYDEVIEMLGACPLFRGMNAKAIASALDAVGWRMVHLEAGSVFATAGKMVQTVDIIIRGSISSCMMGPSGKELKVSTLKAGTLVAPAYLFGENEYYPVSTEADSDTDMLRMTKERFRHLIDTNTQLRWNYIALLSDTTSFITHKMRMLSLANVHDKLAALLLQEVRRQGSRTVTLHQSRKQIAEMLGIQKFSVVRQLRTFQEEGAIAIDGKTITILDADKLG